MDTQITAAEPQHPYSPRPWATTNTTNTTTNTVTPSSSPNPGAQALSPDGSHLVDPAVQYHFLPLLIPPQSNVFQAQLLHYNKLISPSRGGGLLQTPPLPPVVSSPNIQAAPRSRSSSKVSLKDTKGNPGHGSRSHQSEKNRSVITSKEVPSKMAPKQPTDHAKNLPRRPAPSQQSHSSSVPSTPHQHARQFSFEDREPSPTATTNHSPRSAYSETNSTLPSLRPLPPRLGGCKYETAQINSRRRMPYKIGNDRLEKLDLKTVKKELTRDEEKKLAADMRDVFEKLLPTPAVEENRQKLVLKLEKIFNDEWPGHDIKVHLFGSSGNLLCSDDSDVDICITTPWPDLEGVCMIANLLANRGMEKVVCISAAKVPIVKIWDPELGLACDMNVNNTLALENTRMVRTYVEIDDRVRQLAMIIKHWTRRRILNDAAFGSTLSSYTWICLIIAFLQLRNPPILPSLHQSPHKLIKADGTTSDFADDIEKLSKFGAKNKSSVAELLFQFFRFYAHEFDYEKHVLSVRVGKLLSKNEKNWHYALNNGLCVEEPFNTSRNLGNTADEYSFKGLHTELRRAFDLISAGKFDEACEQFVFPKEEERVWTRPATQSRPVLLRSSSQQAHSGRGGRGNHRGGRHNYRNNNNNNNRRASSSVPAYDNNMFVQQANITQEMASWYANQQLRFQYAQPEYMMAAYQMTLQNMYQVPFVQQNIGQNVSQNVGQARMSNPDRSRTNSFDNPPLSAPLQPNVFPVYGMPPFFTNAYDYPQSPGGNQDFRRPLQRPDEGLSATGSLRSHSQPASRSPSGQPAGYFGNGQKVPTFTSDDTDLDETPKATTDSPHSDEGKYNSFFLGENSSPGKANGLGDLPQSSPGRRRLSTDQLPQTILDRRMRRTSRSPSPLGHARAFSTSTSAPNPTVSASQSRNLGRPLVVNGSGLKTSITNTSPRQASGTESNASDESLDGLRVNTTNLVPLDGPRSASVASTSPQLPNQSPVIVNGSQVAPAPAPAEPSFRERVDFMTSMSSTYLNTPHIVQDPPANGNSRLSPSTRQRLMSRQPQNGVIAPLDLAISDHRFDRPIGELSHLSPVYETRTPSPTAVRKPDKPRKANEEKPKPAPRANGVRENGHTRGAKSESDGGWQKAVGKGKKKVNGQGEVAPKHESERKGG